MLKTKAIFWVVVFFLISVSLGAQKMLKPFDSVSKKKTSYITLMSGEEIECKIKKIKRAKKGLIKELEVTVDGEKRKYPVEEIKQAYFPQSGLDKFMKFDNLVTDPTLWNDSNFNEERLKDGYALFEMIDIVIKGEERKLLMQLLNPFPGTRVKVYHDPQAGERGGMRVGGFKVTKSLESNYYISKDGEIANRLRDKDYKKEFDSLFGDCREVEKEYGKKKNWKKFEEALFLYNNNCPKE